MALNLTKARQGLTRKTRMVGNGIRLSETDYQNLLSHCVSRLEIAKNTRSQYIETFKMIDKEYYAWLLRDADDKKRMRHNLRGLGVKPVDTKLSLIFAQVDEAVTYLLSVLAPDSALYSAITTKDKKAIADGFAALMNKHAQTFEHFRAYAMFLITAMKYNFAGFGVDWVERYGNIVVNDALSGTPQVRRAVVADGNEITPYDSYNLLIDPSVSAVDISTKGEYFGHAEVTTEFRLRKAAADEDLHNVDELTAFEMNASLRKFYESHPVVRNEHYGSVEGNTDWFSLLTYNAAARESGIGYEVTTGYFWLIPSRFNLSKSNNYEIWRIMLGGDTVILNAKHQDNAHGMLPVNITVPFEDHFGWQTKGPVERLIAHQNFASYVMNTHQRAVRKKLYGVTFYDAQRMPQLASDDDVDMAGAKIGVNSNGADIDLRKLVAQFNDGPETTQTLENIQVTTELMQDVLPTRMQQQVAGLDRATQYQAAAVVQAANRRNLKIAKIINSQAMARGRQMQMYNILQKQRAVELVTDGGAIISVDPKQLRGANIEFDIGDGLKGLDRLALVMNIKEVLNAVLQSQQAAQQIDIVGVINYWTSLLGDGTDFRQFKIASPIDQLPADQRNLAFQLLQQYAQQQAQQEQQSST